MNYSKKFQQSIQEKSQLKPFKLKVMALQQLILNHFKLFAFKKKKSIEALENTAQKK